MTRQEAHATVLDYFSTVRDSDADMAIQLLEVMFLRVYMEGRRDALRHELEVRQQEQLYRQQTQYAPLGHA